MLTLLFRSAARRPDWEDALPEAHRDREGGNAGAPASGHIAAQRQYEQRKREAQQKISDILSQKGIRARSGPQETMAFIDLYK